VTKTSEDKRMVTDHCYLTSMEVLNMDENDDDYDIDEENWIFLLMYDYVVNVQQVHQLKKILHYMKTNDNYMVDY
jgi:hypothetical protein